MAIHIGQLIQEEVDKQKLTYKEFGALIHKNEKTIPDIYTRESISLDLLITICAALKKDFLSFYYREPPLLDIREDDEVSKLKRSIEVKTDEYDRLQREFEHLSAVLAITKESLAIAKDLIEELKNKREKHVKEESSAPIVNQESVPVDSTYNQ